MSKLALRNVSKLRGARRVLDHVDVTFGAGRLTAVIGPNGAGKSTLLEVAAGLLAPDEGSVELNGDAIATFHRRLLATRRAYLPQRARVEWPISVERVVALGLTPVLPAFGSLSAAMRSRIGATLERYDLTALRDRAATHLSGGELARVMMARAVVGEPEILIVDEPTEGLDPRHKVEAGRRLRALADTGRTVIVALHDLDLALRIADDVVALKSGRVAAHGTLSTVFADAVLTSVYDVEVRVLPYEGVIRFLD
jgi:iron complex transport system ATP-binding protein